MRPSLILGGGKWKQISAGQFVTCGVRADGSLWCWGRGSGGQLGLAEADWGDARARFAPTRVGQMLTWDSVAVGPSVTCATMSDGTGWCWGDNQYGAVGAGAATIITAPTRIAGTWQQVDPGDDGTCGIRADQSLWCWGPKSATPKRVSSSIRWSMVRQSTGTCGLDSGGTPWCWGFDLGALPLIGKKSASSPTRTTLTGRWRKLVLGGRHGCAISAGGELWCWGNNKWGQLGHSASDAEREPPARVGSRSDWIDVGAGSVHTCALRETGDVLCWGGNDVGQLGDGTIVNHAEPSCVGLLGPR